jgi:hypothetical protein
MTTEKVFHADDKYVLRLLNVVIHEHQFKRKGKYYKFHFDKEAYNHGLAFKVPNRGENNINIWIPVKFGIKCQLVVKTI